MRTIRRDTARVLPVNTEGRVLLLHGWDPANPADPFWFTIGGAAEPGETLRQAAARELREEAGIALDEKLLGEPVQISVAEFTWSGVHFINDQTCFAILLDAAEISFDGQEALERATIDTHGWLLPEELEDGSRERPGDPGIPGLMRAAVASVWPARLSRR
jgi:8-oxo-dGTP pyrophosphatase MutT (NUDIX family)